MNKYVLGIVIPTYKEKENISDLLEKISEEVQQAGISTLVLVMDDNSPDGTAELAKASAEKLNTNSFKIEVKVRPGKMGLASAYIQGFEHIMDKVEFLQEMDADFSHNPKYLKEIVNQAKAGYDYVIGSRNISGGSVVGWGPFRNLVSKMGSLYSKIILGVNINDFTGGFNLYKTEVFKKLDLQGIKAEGYLFQIEMKYKAAKLGFKFIEVPIIFVDRQKGKSKFSKKIILEALLGVIRLRFS
jgi:dolichol-phosphate mannosyltransferase